MTFCPPVGLGDLSVDLSCQNKPQNGAAALLASCSQWKAIYCLAAQRAKYVQQKESLRWMRGAERTRRSLIWAARRRSAAMKPGRSGEEQVQRIQLPESELLYWTQQPPTGPVQLLLLIVRSPPRMRPQRLEHPSLHDPSREDLMDLEGAGTVVDGAEDGNKTAFYLCRFQSVFEVSISWRC